MKIRSHRKTIKKNASFFAITDIVMNIFIFFFIMFNFAGSLKTEQESQITDIGVPHESDEPPRINEKPPPEPKTPLEVLIRVEVDSNGKSLIQLRDSSGRLTRIALAQLTEEINKSSLTEEEGQKTPSVIITTHQDIIYDYVVKVLDAVKASKYKKIALMAVKDFGQETQ
ncbi:hypothetical protein FJZ31_07560 [Candidatus Poribacteria bacterium]|nr:hypothetical protein [Candidatus Poribacteria bacterium]